MFSSIKKYFFSGLAVFLPLALTVYICIWALNFAENIFGKYLRPFFLSNYDFYFWGIGLVVLVVIILFCGFLISNYFGRALHRQTEKIMLTIPLMGSIYPAFREIALFLFKESGPENIQQVVLVEWPMPACYAIGFLTGRTPEVVRGVVGKDLVNVLIPSVPNPLTGFVMMLPRDKVTVLSMSVENAIKLVVSGGVVDPCMAVKHAADA